jgi:hypothetical protein
LARGRDWGMMEADQTVTVGAVHETGQASNVRG